MEGGLYLMGGSTHRHHERGIDIVEADEQLYEEEIIPWFTSRLPNAIPKQNPKGTRSYTPARECHSHSLAGDNPPL